LRRDILLLSFLVIPIFLWSKAPEVPAQKTVEAVKADGQIIIDGLLDEKIWESRGYNDFIQSDPIDGAKPSEKTMVWIAYDEKALYVAGLFYDSQPEAIVKRLGRRDDFVDSDWFIFAVDPYYDRRTGYKFAVNPAGSIVDWALYNDISSDKTWDGIWDWSTHVDEKGWTVEIRIPYNQLRFPKKNQYIWGVNFQRIIKRKNETINFVWIPKEESGYVSHFAKLVGIKNINPGRHIEFLPYSVAETRFSPSEPGNPFETGENYIGNIGFDLKVGLKSNLTLDTTANPDFGQVEVDPAVINLSAYETYYQEKRPFFIEGSSIFNAFGEAGSQINININWSSPALFYSRRIGRHPQGFVSRNGYVNFPDRSTILGAFKLTGKVANGWNLGFINAFTAREYAEIDSNGERFKEEVEPFSYYGVLRTQKEFNDGAQGFGFIATSIARDLRNENLKNILNKKAFSLGLDGWTYLDTNKIWLLYGWMGTTRIEGTRDDILRLQQTSLHYFQRPDSTHVKLNEDATSLSGWGGRFTLNKQKGNFLFNMAIGVLSPGFDPNDAGFQHGSSDTINFHILLGYYWPHPGKLLRSWDIAVAPFRNYDFGANKTWDGYLLIADAQLLNYWELGTMLAYNPKTISNDLTRGGPLAIIPSGRQINFNINSDSRKPIIVSAFSSYYLRPSEGVSWDCNVSLRWKPRSNVSFSLGPGYQFHSSKIHWVTRVNDPLMTETYGTRYVFGKLEQIMPFAEIRLNWTFSPKLSLQLYLQPFLGVGKYDEFKELARPKSFEYNIFGENQSTITFSEERYTVDPDGPGPAPSFSFYDPDFNLKSLRGTMVFRWEYHPGSALYLVWTQNRADHANPGDFNFNRDLEDLFTAPGDNIFLLKISYRWNM